MEIREQNLSGAVRNYQRAVKSIQKTGDQLQHLLVIGLLVSCSAFRQIAPLGLARDRLQTHHIRAPVGITRDEVVDVHARKGPKSCQW
jgi:hypothetical protein